MKRNQTLKRGLINRYKTRSIFERIGKDFRFIVRWLFLWVQHGFRSRTILVWPEMPSRRSTIYKICKKLGYVLTNNLSLHSKAAVFWEDKTIRGRYNELVQINKRMPVINRYSDNILKTWVDDFFHEVFGYKTRINPLTFNGFAVKKSEYNAQHDGTIVQCPLAKAESDTIYQIVINNLDENGFYEDLRIPIFGGKIPFVYRKLKAAQMRFETAPEKAYVEETNNILSREEQSLVIEFARVIKLEFGEIDGLRNRDDGRLYLIDVNNTPYGPPANLAKEDVEKVLDSMANEFKCLLDKIKQSPFD